LKGINIKTNLCILLERKKNNINITTKKTNKGTKTSENIKRTPVNATLNIIKSNTLSIAMEEIDFESLDWKWFYLKDIPKLKAHHILFEIFRDSNAIQQIKQALKSYKIFG